jgi:hypothetical protein
VIGSLFFEHAAPLGAVVGALLLAVAWTIWSFARYVREGWVTGALAALRILFFLGLGWCLLRPAWKEAVATVVKPRFLVLVDTSASMQLSPPGEPSRWAVAQSVLAQSWPEALRHRAEVELYPFATDLGERATDPRAAAGWKPTGNATRLHASLRKLVERYRGQPLAGVLVLSDGLDDRPEDTPEPWPCPIFTVQLEPPAAWAEQPDLRVAKIDSPRRVVAGWESKLTAVVAGSGTQGRVFTVELFEDDRLLAEQPAQLPAEGGQREVTFPVAHPKVGTFTYTVRVPPLPGETVTNDNAHAVSVQVVDTKNRLLYVEGPPRFESKFLARVLQANPQVTPLIFLQGPNRQFFTVGARGAMTTEMTPEQLAAFKIVILGDLTAAGLGEERARALVKFVGDGGSLVLLGGPNAWDKTGFAATPLAELLPARRPAGGPPQEGRFPVRWTAEGKAHPAFAGAETAPPILSIFPGAELARGAVTLAETDSGAPVIAAQRFGQGKVAALLTDSLWRWQLEPGAGGVYEKFWARLLDWLTPTRPDAEEAALDLFADAEQLFLGEVLMLQARAADPAIRAVTCEVVAPDGRRISFPMTPQAVVTTTGRSFPGFGLEFTAQEPGLHRAVATAIREGQRIESAPCSVYVKPFAPETAPRPANAELLRALATASGGRHLLPAELPAALANLELPTTEESRVTYATRWNTWPVLLGLIGLLTVEWILRNRRHLP